MLASLENVKGKLGIALTDTSQDEAITLVLQDASVKILSLGRYSETDLAGRQDIFQEVQVETPVALTLRPVSAVTLVEGRTPGNTDWVTLAYDLTDATKGEVSLLGAESWWPPTPDRIVRPRFSRWREPTWPIVRVTYDVTGIGSEGNVAPAAVVPSDLRDATAALAAYWYDRHLALASESAQVGQIRRTYMDADIPSWVLSSIASHMEEQRARWVA